MITKKNTNKVKHKNFKLSFILLFMMSFYLKSQTVPVYKIDGLLKRIYNTSDTVYVVNFWATWCKPCVAELPGFEKLHKMHINEPVKVLLVSMDFKEELNKKLIPFIAKHNYTTEIVLLDEVNGNDFINKIDERWSGALPATLITSKNKLKHEFIEKTMSYELLEEKLKK